MAAPRKFTPDVVEEMQRLRREGATREEVAARFGIHVSNVSLHAPLRRNEAPHRVTVLDPEQREGLCSRCGAVRLWRKRGEWRCSNGERRHRGRPNGYRMFVGASCERCGFEPEHPCQLDVHHRDGNHNNDAPENLATLCANCHRLEHAPVGFTPPPVPLLG